MTDLTTVIKQFASINRAPGATWMTPPNFQINSERD
jgi:hypothetical protein